MNRNIIFLLVGGMLLLAFIMATVIYKNSQSTLQGASGGRNQSIVERQNAPVKGPVDARVTIVEFFDPACGTCADFYPLVKNLIDQYPGKVREIAPGCEQDVEAILEDLKRNIMMERAQVQIEE